MLHSTSLVLFESTDADSVLSDPVNEDWLAVVRGVSGELYDGVARRYYLALSHFRRQRRRYWASATPRKMSTCSCAATVLQPKTS